MGRSNANKQTPAVTPDPNTGAQTPATPAVTPDTSATVTTPNVANTPSAPTTKDDVKMVKIKLEITREHKDDVYVTCNKRKYQIKRGVEVEVPWFVAEILRNQEKALMKLFENQAKAQEKVL